MTTERRFKSTVRLLFVFVALVARPALAADTKTYFGSFCVPDQDEDRARVAVVTGTVVAQGGGTAKILCPIIKNVTNNATLEEVSIQFWKSTSGTATCNLSAFRANVSSSTSDNIIARVAKTVSGTGTKSMVFTNFASGESAPWASNFMYYTLHCSLPSGDRLQHYRVREAGTRTQEAKIYPPTMCRPDIATNTARYWFQPGNFTVASPGGWLQAAAQTNNPGSGTFAMVCPVVGDISANTTGTALAYISLMPPITAGKSITCTLYSSNNNLPVDSHSASYLANGSEFLSQTFDLDLSNGATWARYHIKCTAPDLGDAKILGYRIQEN
jgi:hypothetical protein